MPNSNSLSTYTTMMRVTSAGRPYVKDLFDLFSAFLIQLPLTDHRSLFRTYPCTFTTEEAVKCLADLKFTHVVRTIDPNDATRHVATRTTTTFSMSPKMAKALGTHMLNARLVEDAVNPQNRTMKDRGIWRPTPKGKYMIHEFSKRAHVSIQHLGDTLARVQNFKIFVFDRLRADDRLAFSRPNMTNAFRTMFAWLPMERLIADDVGGVRATNLYDYQYTFYGYQVFEWICEYTTAVSAEESQMIAAEFVLYGWISEINDKSSQKAERDTTSSPLFNMKRKTIYYLTERGQRALEWDDLLSSSGSSHEKAMMMTAKSSELAAHMQQAVAERLLPTEADAEPHQGPVVAVVATGKNIEGSAAQPAEPPPDPNAYNCDFGFSKDSQSGSSETTEDNKEDVQELDDMTKKLLRLRKSGRINTPAAAATIPHAPASSQDSGFEVATSITEGDEEECDRQPGINKETRRPGNTDVPGIGDHQKDSQQWIKLQQILENPLTRMYYRDFLKSTFCEENINFWVDYNNLCKKHNNRRAGERELLADCYRIYGIYLAPSAPSEVNIDHQLRQEIIYLVSSTFKVTSAPSTTDLPFSSGAVQVTSPQSMTVTNHGKGRSTLKQLLKLYDRVNDHLCRTMAQDSIPRFVKTQKYRDLLASTSTTLSIMARTNEAD
ncbi:hypothetical protein BX666DRAFT_1989839 [Dichotomocladium elegans]|nr:hypothetical protein BX666DRAFT_1989839 [Dichotomocladium elegans]